MEARNKVFSFLGLAMRGRRLVSGEYQTLEAIRKNEAKLVLIAEDSSDNTKKLFTDKCTFYHVPVWEFGKKEDLGRAIGKDLRSSLAVCDDGLAASIVKMLEAEK